VTVLHRLALAAGGAAVAAALVAAWSAYPEAAMILLMAGMALCG